MEHAKEQSLSPRFSTMGKRQSQTISSTQASSLPLSASNTQQPKKNARSAAMSSVKERITGTFKKSGTLRKRALKNPIIKLIPLDISKLTVNDPKVEQFWSPNQKRLDDIYNKMLKEAVDVKIIDQQEEFLRQICCEDLSLDTGKEDCQQDLLLGKGRDHQARTLSADEGTQIYGKRFPTIDQSLDIFRKFRQNLGANRKYPQNETKMKRFGSTLTTFSKKIGVNIPTAQRKPSMQPVFITYQDIDRHFSPESGFTYTLLQKSTAPEGSIIPRSLEVHNPLTTIPSTEVLVGTPISIPTPNAFSESSQRVVNSDSKLPSKILQIEGSVESQDEGESAASDEFNPSDFDIENLLFVNETGRDFKFPTSSNASLNSVEDSNDEMFQEDHDIANSLGYGG